MSNEKYIIWRHLFNKTVFLASLNLTKKGLKKLFLSKERKKEISALVGRDHVKNAFLTDDKKGGSLHATEPSEQIVETAYFDEAEGCMRYKKTEIRDFT